MMKRSFFAAAMTLSLACGVFAQDPKPWTELTKKDAEKVLNDSAWVRTQIDTDMSELFYSPTKPGNSSVGKSQAAVGKITDQQSINNNRADQGATNEAVAVNYRIRLFSAKPVREAIARLVVLGQDQRYEELTALMQPFVDRDFSQFIVVNVAFDASDGRFLGPAIQAFSSATSETLKNRTYLERKDGKRLYLMDYRAPQADGLGAKFVFERSPDGRSFLGGDSGNFRFYSEVSDKIKLNVKFSVSELSFDGRLEY